MHKLEAKEIKERLEELDIEIKRIDAIIPNYKKSSEIFKYIALICIAISIAIYSTMSTIGDKKIFLTITILTVASTVASLSDRNMAKSQQKKRDDLFDERCKLNEMLDDY